MDDFDLNQELLTLQEERESYMGSVVLADVDAGELKAQVTGIVDTLETNETAIGSREVFYPLQDMLKHFGSLPGVVRTLLHGVVVSGLDACVTSLKPLLTSEQLAADLDNERNILERWVFLYDWFVYAAESAKAPNGEGESSTATGKKKKTSSKTRDAAAGRDVWDWMTLKSQLLKTMGELLALPLQRIYHMAADRDAFVGAVTKPIYLMIENKDNLKSATVRPALFDVLALCIGRYQHGFAAMTSVLQALPYFDHLPDSMADFVAHAAIKHNCTNFSDDILLDISKMSFNVQDTTAPKAFGGFLLQLAEAAPRLVNKKLSLLVKHIDSESYTMRMAIVEVVGKLVLAKPSTAAAASDDEAAKAAEETALKSLFDVLEERALDNNAYVRTRLIQTLITIVEANALPVNMRSQFLKICLQRLNDKSSAVRRRAVQLLASFVKTHPFRMDGGQLPLSVFSKKIADIDQAIHDLVPVEVAPAEEETSPAAEKKTSKKTSKKAVADKKKSKKAHAGSKVKKGRKIVDSDEEEEAQDDDDDDEGTEQEVDKENVDDGEGEDDDDEEEAVIKEEPVAVAAAPAVDAETVAKVTMLRLQRRYYQDVVDFLTLIGTSMPILRQLMVSNYKTDVIETVIFFTTASEFGIEFAQEGVKEMVHLVWSKDDVTVAAAAAAAAPAGSTTSAPAAGTAAAANAPMSIDDIDNKDVKDRTVKDHVISAYQSLFLTEDPALPAKERAQRIAKNLFNLTKDLTLAQLTSLDELLFLMMKKGLIATELLHVLWHYFGTKNDVPKLHRRSAIMLLSMLGRARPEMIAEKLDLLVATGLTGFGLTDSYVALYTCFALQRLNPRQRGAKAKVSIGHDSFVRYSPLHPLTVRLSDLVLGLNAPYAMWTQVTEQAIECLYLLTESPDKTCADLIRHMTARTFSLLPTDEATATIADEDVQVSSETMAQMLFVVGHVAIKQIAHLEAIDRHWKARRASKESQASKDKKAAASAAAIAPVPTGKKGKDKTAASVAAAEAADELDQVVGAGNAEDDFTEMVQQVRESELLYGEESLLAVFGPMVAQICSMTKSFEDNDVQTAAVLCLCKLMCVSAEFCESQLQLLFTLLEKSPSEVIRANIVISLGDMAICFSSLIDENISHLYKRLSDPSLFVRSNTLMVLSHLILNGMIKVKGQISEMAKCLNEPDAKISELAKLFFAEMAAKDNAIYNNLPDIISGLSSGDNALSEEAFRKVIDYIFSFIQKDKQTENLVEKLCNRMGQTEVERQWRDLSFCLSRLSYTSERSMKKLVEGFPHYKDKLHDEFIWNNMNDIVNKARKFQKAEMKPALDEFESRLRESHDKGVDDNQTVQKAVAAAKKATSSAKRAATSRKAKKAVVVDDDDDDD